MEMKPCRLRTLRTEKISFLGQHGGLNEQEMVVPFAMAGLLNGLKE